MPRFSLLLSCLVAVALGLFLAVAPAAVADDAGESWIEVFNGRDLTGWRANPEHPESFRVEDGVLVVDGPRRHLFWVGESAGSERCPAPVRRGWSP